MLVSHDVQLNSKSIIENSFGQLFRCHRVCVCVCTALSPVYSPDVAASALGGTLLQGGGCVVTAKAAYDPLLLALSILCSALLYSAVMLGLSKVICVGQGEITEV